MRQTCCFTGHRPPKIGGYNEDNPTTKRIRLHLQNEIYLAINNGYKEFISGMALGVDTIAAEIVLEIRESYPIQLICAIPFEGQENMWTYDSRHRWRTILDSADEVIHISSPGYAAWKMQKRNEWMVDVSSLVIAVWDGSTGGTANCISYAKNATLPPEIHIITP